MDPLSICVFSDERNRSVSICHSWVLYRLDATILLVFKIPFIGYSSFSFLAPHITCFDLAGHPQVCLIRFAAPSAMLWSAARPKHVVRGARKENEGFPIKGILKTNKIVAYRRYKTQLWQI
jgi:hypothetical protein